MSSERERRYKCKEHQKFPTHGTISAAQTEAEPSKDPDLSETLGLSLQKLDSNAKQNRVRDEEGFLP